MAAKIAWASWGVTIALVIASAWLLLLNGGADPGEEPSTLAQKLSVLVVATSSATAGALIVSRQPRNLIAWLFIGMGVAEALVSFSSYLAVYTCVVAASRHCRVHLAVVADAMWFPQVTAGMAGLFLFFPHGSAPRGWRRLLFSGTVAVGAVAAAGTLIAPSVYALEGFSNPWYIPSLEWTEPVTEAAGLVVVLVMVAVIDFVVRTVRSSGLERQQNKWLASAGALVVLGAAASVFGNVALNVDLGWTWFIGVAAIPAAVFMAVTRSGLYEIDRIISRTVSYALVLGVLALLFVAVASIPTLALDGETTPTWVIAATTLLVFSLFNPLRRRVQRVIDRRFNRLPYDPGHCLDRIGRELRDEVQPDTIAASLVAVSSEALQPASAQVWVRR